MQEVRQKYGGWIIIAFLTLLPLPFWSAVNQTGFGDAYGFFGNLGKIFGLIGFVLYALNLVLALRRKWLENFFEGLNRVYIAHHITGGLALLFVAFHPLFLAVRLIEFKSLATFTEAAKFLLPRTVDTSQSYAGVERAVSLNAGIIAFVGMVVLLILTFFVKLPYRIWLYTHRFLGVAFAFSIMHVFLIKSDTSQSIFLKYYMITIGIIGLAAFLYRTVFGKMFIRKAFYQIDKIEVNGPMTAMELKPTGKPIAFEPGQFVFISFKSDDGITDEVHPFSIASGKNEDRLRLYIKALGDFTSTVSFLKPGTIAEVEGAFGKFSPARYGVAPQVWIAGGIGITPFLSMARSLADLPQQIYLIYSVNKTSELVETDLLKNYLPENYKNFKFIPYVAEEQGGKFLTVDYIKEAVDGFVGKQVFVCGPPAGVKNRDIHSEEFSMS
jgi:predicted ferric reductase